MPITRSSVTNKLTFDQVIRRLSNQSIIDGLLIIGSASHDNLTPASDYDLVIILSEMPVSIHIGTTYIDRRFTDLIFCTTEQLSEVLSTTKPFDFWDIRGRLATWLETGVIVFDRQGTLRQAQEKAKADKWIQPIDPSGDYAAWQRINYNLQVVRRYVESDDPNYLMAADIRISLFGPQDLFWNYFTIRRLYPDSEKRQIQYLQEHDPEFLDNFNRFLGEIDRNEKFRLYKVLAEHVLEPVGQLWQENETILNINAAVVTPDIEAEALDFWEALIQE